MIRFPWNIGHSQLRLLVQYSVWYQPEVQIRWLGSGNGSFYSTGLKLYAEKSAYYGFKTQADGITYILESSMISEEQASMS
jgi:hypothetical protein